MKPAKQKDKEKARKIAEERITILFDKAAESAREKDLKQADYLVSMAREISMKTNARIPRELKRKYCKHCYCYIASGERSKTRVNSHDKRVEVRCLSCGKSMYYPLKK
ncbi:MAG: ribonuclease P [Candidatus Altiarchaeota archaeon]